MIINCLTLFPEEFSGFLSTGLIKKALDSKIVDINLIDFRNFSTDKHKRVDDYPYGGGPGMLLMPQPIFDCLIYLKDIYKDKQICNIYMSPGGEVLNQNIIENYRYNYEVINILCGHYEGVDQRVIDELIDMEISIGDFILSGGELPAMVLIDCIMRFLPGFMSNEESYKSESFFGDNLLEYPQYTRPKNFRGREVPAVLLSGNHAEIIKWRQNAALEKTIAIRPDLIQKQKNDKLIDA